MDGTKVATARLLSPADGASEGPPPLGEEPAAPPPVGLGGELVGLGLAVSGFEGVGTVGEGA